ncbi:hypothetical protein H7J86_26415 [Mycobacterium hackensackense]|uniref:hypothetical protein n=1 Tax=Mycobacterium hackensackense TaxID=228909 RepID=UPI002265C616|nr:hypothetical protein [Mycobacterium hackensackense]MCV7255704.1 hypothetical protein [Mycobacterium hackensackense]
MTVWNAAFWSQITGPGLAVLVAAAFVWALATGRLVTGKQHDAVVKKAEIDAESVRVLSLEMAKKTGGEMLAMQLLTTIRESAVTKGGT